MNRRNEKVNGLPALVFWTAVWWIGAELLEKPLLLPAPFQVLACLGRLIQTVSFWQITLTSIGRILLGVACAVVLGTALAVLASRSRMVNALVAPALTAIQATPVASFTILVLIWLNRDYVPVLICALMGLPVVFQSVCAGIQVTDLQLLEMARVFRLSRMQIMKRIYVPTVMPFFRTACCSALGLGWKAGIAAEVLTVPRASIGRMISESKLYLMTEELFAWTLMVIVLSMLLQKWMLLLLKGSDGHA